MQAKGNHLDAEPAKKQLEGSQIRIKALSDIAKNQKTDEIESVEQLKVFAKQIQQEIAKFNQAVLLLSSQDGIALSTPENIHLSADAQINQIAGDSINFSSQKNLIVHAKNKISLFSVMDGINFIAAQGKFNIHAQANALELFAKLGITISSTEDKIEINSPKEVQITGKSSRITLNSTGILCETDRLFEVKSGQQKFQGGQKVKTEIPLLPIMNEIKSFTNKWDFYNLFYENKFSEVKYKLINTKNSTYISGNLDAHGRTQRVDTVENQDYEILIGANEAWTVSIDDGNENNDFEYHCNCEAHDQEI